MRERAVETLVDMAKITHGQYYRAGDTPGLLDACRAIDRLERTDVSSFQYRRYHEGYPWFAGAALLLFAAALAAGFHGLAAIAISSVQCSVFSVQEDALLNTEH